MSSGLLDQLDGLCAGTNITLRIHPNTITEFTAGDQVLLAFAPTMDRLEGEADGFFLCLLLYGCALAGLVSVIRRALKK